MASPDFLLTAECRPDQGLVVEVVQVGAEVAWAEAAGWVVVADATLHGPQVPSPQTAESIALSLGVDPETALHRLEGEYRFVAWQRQTGHLLAACDVTGRRPIYTTLDAMRLVLGSDARAVAELAGQPRLDPQVLAERAAIAVSDDRRTVWSGVLRAGAGDVLRWEAGRPPRLSRERFWAAFSRDAGDGGLGDAPEGFAAALAQACADRDDGAQVLAVWMSGGYDSTAVFAAAAGMRGATGTGGTVRPVSLRFAASSPGDENDLISQVAAQWGVPVAWVPVPDADALPLETLADRSAVAGDPFVHVYGPCTALLAREARRIGATTALCGLGGDAIAYAAPLAYLPDLASRGRMLEAWREGRALGMRPAAVLRAALEPVLRPQRTAAGRDAASALLRPRLPRWLGGRAVHVAALQDAAALDARPRAGESRDSAFVRAVLEAPVFERVQEELRAIALAEGVRHRSPLLDERVVAFCAARPRSDRSWRGETKRLLRASMAGRLPAPVLAPRPRRTGVPADVLGALQRRVAATVDARSLALADLGAVDGDALRAALGAAADGRLPADQLVRLGSTCWVERWLRSSAQRPIGAAPPPAAAGRIRSGEPCTA